MAEEHVIEVLTCPQCGATPVIDEESNVAICEYCGAKFLLPEDEHQAPVVPQPQPQPEPQTNYVYRKTRPGVWVGFAVFCVVFGIFGMSQFSGSGDILDILLGGAFVLTGLYCLSGYWVSKKLDISLRAPAILFFIGACFTATAIQSYTYGETGEAWIQLLLGLGLVVFCLYLTVTRLRGKNK